MKKNSDDNGDDDLRDEYDESMLREGVRGKYADRFATANVMRETTTTDKNSNHEEGSLGQTVTASDAYGALTSLVADAERIRWTRLNTLLVFDAIFFAAWVGVFTRLSIPSREVILAILCLPGVVVGILFARLGWRSSQYLNEFYDLAHEMEGRFPQTLPRPFHVARPRRERAAHGFERFTRSEWLVTAIPVMFSILFILLAVASFLIGQ